MLPVETNKIYELEISGLGSAGEGVGKFKDFTIFVKGALPGEIVSVKIEEVKKNYRLNVVKKISPSNAEGDFKLLSSIQSRM